MTDAGIAELKQLKNLKTLTVSKLDVRSGWDRMPTNNFTDRGLAHLTELPTLQSLDISGNPEMFDVLQREVFPKLLKQSGDQPIRV
ncbi:MAG: hypothetical protein ACKV2Q_34460 [Planctomycetaceae bacterium]